MVHDQSAPDPGADREHAQVGTSTARPEPVLCGGKRHDIVLEMRLDSGELAEPVCQTDIVPAEEHRAEHAPVRCHLAAHANSQ